MQHGIDVPSPLGLCPPLLARPFARGAEMIAIAGISGVAVPNGTTGAKVRFRWPYRLMLRAWILMPRSGLRADAGQLQLRIVDTHGENVFDGLGLSATSNFVSTSEAGIVPSGIALTGWTWSPQWSPFGRAVDRGDEWTFQVANGKTGGGSITPRLLFQVELPLDPAYGPNARPK